MAESWRGGGTLIFNFSTMSTSLALPWLGLAWLDLTRLGLAWLGLGRAHTRVRAAEGEAEQGEEGTGGRDGGQGAIWAAR